MNHYVYWMLTADLECGINKHPQDQMKELGFNVVKCEPVSIADCWWFRTTNEITPLPPYIKRMKDDFKFSDEIDRSTDNKAEIKRYPPIYKPDGSYTDYGKFINGLPFKD